jgi:hypothetical protein
VALHCDAPLHDDGRCQRTVAAKSNKLNQIKIEKIEIKIENRITTGDPWTAPVPDSNVVAVFVRVQPWTLYVSAHQHALVGVRWGPC